MGARQPAEHSRREIAGTIPAIVGRWREASQQQSRPWPVQRTAMLAA